jgi:hypothetical protein
MPAIIAALIGTAAFGQGVLGARQEKKANRRYSRRLGRSLKATESIRGRELAQREGLTRQATQELVGGYDAARREVSRLGRSGKQGALDRANQQQASITQNLADRGLGSLTSGANLSRGIGADLTRQYQGIDEGLASLFSNLSLGRSQAQAGGTQELAALAQERGLLGANLAQMGNLREMYGASPFGGNGPIPLGPQNFGQSLLGGVQTGLGIYAGAGGGGGGQQMDLSWLFGGQPGGFNPRAGQSIQPGQSFVPRAY